MTKDEAILLAKTVAEREGWPWQGPIVARAERTLVLFGPRRWRVMSNAQFRGGNVNVLIDDKTGRVVARGFCRR